MSRTSIPDSKIVLIKTESNYTWYKSKINIILYTVAGIISIPPSWWLMPLIWPVKPQPDSSHTTITLLFFVCYSSVYLIKHKVVSPQVMIKEHSTEYTNLPLSFGWANNSDFPFSLFSGSSFIFQRCYLDWGSTEPDNVTDVGSLRPNDGTHRWVWDIQECNLLQT